jgi:hypothetical protein
MSKKRKRQVRKSRPLKQETPVVEQAPVTFSTSRTLKESFTPDYTYVIKDLRRIGILAGSFIAIYIILSFFI